MRIGSMGKVEQLENERTELMAGQRTHAEWVKVMERLAEISAELLILKNESDLPRVLVDPIDGIIIQVPPLSTYEQRTTARQKLDRMNHFLQTRTHAAV